MNKEEALKILQNISIDYDHTPTGASATESIEAIDAAMDYAIECVQRQPTREEILKVGLALNRVATLQDDESLARTRSSLDEVEAFIKKGAGV